MLKILDFCRIRIPVIKVITAGINTPKITLNLPPPLENSENAI
jgi:hypothetical protein